MAARSPRAARRGAAAVAGGCLFALACATVGLSCSGKNTQKPALEVVVSTDLRFLQDYNSVEMRVTQQAADGTYPAIADKDLPIVIPLPQVLTIEPGSRAFQGARITAIALKDAKIVVSTTAQVQVPTSQVLELDMFLGADCVNVSCPGAMSTCRDGACTSEVIDPMKLKSFDPNDVEAGPLFDGTLPEIDAGKDGTSPDARGDTGSTGPGPDASTPDVHADAPADAPLDSPKEASSSCGAAGETCCPFHQCNSGGCCVYGTCVGQGAACIGLGNPASPPICNGSLCGGNCGAPNMACCMGMSGNTCTTPFTVCNTGNCGSCGGTNQACCPGAVCTPGNVCQQNGGDSGTSTCTQCGGPNQTCCDVNSGVQGAPMAPCMPGSGLTCNVSNKCT